MAALSLGHHHEDKRGPYSGWASAQVPASTSRGWWDSVTRWLRRGRDGEEDSGQALEPKPRFRLVCISREAGAGGSSIGRLVSKKLNWKFYDREIIETISERMGITIEEATAFDELPPTRVQAWALPVMEEHYASHETYLDHLEKLVDSVGREGNAIIVGRGAGFCLPREWILNVRVVCPLEDRAARLAERLGVSQRTARRAAVDLDRRRDRFARLQLNIDAHDPHLYDLILNSQTLGLEIASELIVKAIEAGKPRQPSLSIAQLDHEDKPDAGDLKDLPDSID